MQVHVQVYLRTERGVGEREEVTNDYIVYRETEGQETIYYICAANLRKRF